MANIDKEFNSPTTMGTSFDDWKMSKMKSLDGFGSLTTSQSTISEFPARE